MVTLATLPTKTGTVDGSGFLHLSESGADKKLIVNDFLAKIAEQYSTDINAFLATASSIAGLDSLNKKGTDIASATTINLNTTTGNYVNITGTTTITGITLAEGKQRLVRFAGALILTHGASLVLPSAANITTAAGDFALFVGDTTGITRCVGYTRANGYTVNNTFSNKNAIINGDFNIWQRGTSFTAVADGTYTADRFLYLKTGAMVHTVSRSTDVPTVLQAGRLFNYSLLTDCTTVDSSIAAGDYCVQEHRIEGFNWLPLAQKTITLSFWVKGTKTGIHCVYLKSSIGDRSYVAEYTVDTTNTWEYKTITFIASPSAGTWDYTTGIGISIGFTLAAGSTFQTTAGSWQTGGFLATSNQVNACDSTSNDFRICGVQLEAGSVATPFEQRSIGQELLLCQRYFEILGGQSTNEPLCTGYASSTVQAQGVVKYAVQKRSAPTVTFSATNLFRFNNATSNFTCSNIVANNVSDNTKTFILTLTIAGVVANTGGLIDTVSTSGTISISSEL